jgi:hypothetical protein
MNPLPYLAALLGAVWLLVRVLVGVLDLRDELHRLGLD